MSRWKNGVRSHSSWAAGEGVLTGVRWTARWQRSRTACFSAIGIQVPRKRQNGSAVDNASQSSWCPQFGVRMSLPDYASGSLPGFWRGSLVSTQRSIKVPQTRMPARPMRSAGITASAAEALNTAMNHTNQNADQVAVLAQIIPARWYFHERATRVSGRRTNSSNTAANTTQAPTWTHSLGPRLECVSLRTKEVADIRAATSGGPNRAAAVRKRIRSVSG